MNRNDINEIFNAVDGKKKLIAWAKKSSANYAQLLSMLGRSVLQDGVSDAQHVSPVDDAAMRHTIEAALAGIITARKRGDFNLTTRTFEGGPSVDVNTGVSDADTHVANRPGIDHGIQIRQTECGKWLHRSHYLNNQNQAKQKHCAMIFRSVTSL
jgi:hypothetical protein